MGLLGRKIAVASVGMSCQPAFQIEENRSLIEDLVGEKLEHHAMPFDSLLCGAGSAARMIRDGAYFPKDRDELESIGDKPWWPRYGCHLWHGRPGKTCDDWARFVAKGQHIRESWDKIEQAERRVFVWSDAQNNVHRELIAKGRVPLTVGWEHLVELHAALVWRFKSAELHVVTPAPRSASGPIIVHVIARDRSQWSGNKVSWWIALTRVVAMNPARSGP